MMSRERRRVGFLVNPIAGIGGRLGLPGSDDIPLEISPSVGPALKRAALFLRELGSVLERRQRSERAELEIVMPNGFLGEEALSRAGVKLEAEIIDVYDGSTPTTPAHMEIAARTIGSTTDVIFFVGGDGTAHLVARSLGSDKPLVGVPGGTKTYSGVFARSLRAAVELLVAYLEDSAHVSESEIVLVNEASLARGLFEVIDVLPVNTLETSEGFHQFTKELYSGTDEEKEAVAEFVARELLEPGDLVLLGPGSTVRKVAERLGWSKPLIGLACGNPPDLFCASCESRELSSIVESWSGPVKLVVSPLGRSGFVLGRGSGALTKRVLSKIDPDSLIIVSAWSKLAKIDKLFVDLDDWELSKKFSGYKRVVVGYGEFAVKKIEAL